MERRRDLGGGVGTSATRVKGGGRDWRYAAYTGNSTGDTAAESTLGDDAHTLGQVVPIIIQQPHVQVMSPAAAHMVNTSMMTAPCAGRCIWHTRCITPYIGEPRIEDCLTTGTPHSPQIFLVWHSRVPHLNSCHGTAYLPLLLASTAVPLES